MGGVCQVAWGLLIMVAPNMHEPGAGLCGHHWPVHHSHGAHAPHSPKPEGGTDGPN